MLTWLGIAAVVVVLFLCRSLLRRFGTDEIQEFIAKRSASSLIATRGDLVDSGHRIDVAMALTNQTLFYENKNMEASLDLQSVNEIEYDTSVGTGASVEDGEVLRLRFHSQCFEFIVPSAAVPRWKALLPARTREALQVAHAG